MFHLRKIIDLENDLIGQKYVRLGYIGSPRETHLGHRAHLQIITFISSLLILSDLEHLIRAYTIMHYTSPKQPLKNSKLLKIYYLDVIEQDSRFGDVIKFKTSIFFIIIPNLSDLNDISFKIQQFWIKFFILIIIFS